MHDLIEELFEALGLEPDLDDPALLIDGQWTLCFSESEDGLDMICPLGPLPQDTHSLQRLLAYNYANPVILAADAEQTQLLAILRVGPGTRAQDTLQRLNTLIDAIRQWPPEAAR
jgi:hypothetical protein